MNFTNGTILNPEMSHLQHGGAIAAELTGLESVQRAVLDSESVRVALEAGLPYSHAVNLLGEEPIGKPEQHWEVDSVVLESLRQLLCDAGQEMSRIMGALGRPVEIDPQLSGIWIETISSPGNVLTHRDSEDPDVVRGLASVIPTMFLPSGASVPLLDVPGVQTPGVLDSSFDPLCTTIPGNFGIMGGTTYHRAANEVERANLLDSVAPFYQIPVEGFPRVLASVWGHLR